MEREKKINDEWRRGGIEREGNDEEIVKKREWRRRDNDEKGE